MSGVSAVVPDHTPAVVGMAAHDQHISHRHRFALVGHLTGDGLGVFIEGRLAGALGLLAAAGGERNSQREHAGQRSWKEISHQFVSTRWFARMSAVKSAWRRSRD